MSRDSLGEFEHMVLLAILRQGGTSYSVPIVVELEGRTGRSVAPAAVYIALRRLEKRGLLTSRLEDNDPESGRPRRYFILQDPALEKLREARQAFANLWDGMDAALEAGRAGGRS
jgi:DNA-binding PadR family transcriptional regulator